MYIQIIFIRDFSNKSSNTWSKNVQVYHYQVWDGWEVIKYFV